MAEDAAGKLTMEMIEKCWDRSRSLHTIPILDMTLDEFLNAPTWWELADRFELSRGAVGTRDGDGGHAQRDGVADHGEGALTEDGGA